MQGKYHDMRIFLILCLLVSSHGEYPDEGKIGESTQCETMKFVPLPKYPINLMVDLTCTKVNGLTVLLATKIPSSLFIF